MGADTQHLVSEDTWEILEADFDVVCQMPYRPDEKVNMPRL